MQLAGTKTEQSNGLVKKLDDDLCENDTQSTASVHSTYSLNSQQLAFRQKTIELIILLSGQLDLEKDTLFIAITCLDRLLESGLDQNRRNLDTMALTLLFIAAKVNEIYPPTLDEFIQINSNPIYRNEVVLLQAFIFEKLSYDVMSFATVYSEFKQITQSIKMDVSAEKKLFKILKREVIDFSLLRYGYKAFSLAIVSIFFPKEIGKYDLDISSYASIIAFEIAQDENAHHNF